VLVGPGSASAQVKDRLPPEVARLDAYLARLGLAGLRIRNLERELQRSGAGPAAPAIAGRLAEVFADRLLTAGDSKEGAELTDRLTRLISAHPSTATPRVRLTLLEGDYNRAEAEALKWVGDPSNGPARANAVARLGRCRPQLDRIRDDLLKQIEKLNNELGRLDNGPRRDALEREFEAIAQVANRATYFAGWANFYESLVTQLPAAASERLRVARQGFRRLLGIEPERFKSSDLEGLDGELTARIALGLALVEMASGGTENGNEVFQSLRGPSVNATVRDWVDRWQVWALSRAGLGAEAEATARSAVEGFVPPMTPAKGALCSMLVRGVPGAAAKTAGRARAGAGDVDQANRLVLLGLSGLIRLGRPDLARRLLGGRDLSAAAPPGVLAHWLRGQAALQAAEAGGSADAYTRAQAAFAAAQADPAAASDPVLIADCRFGQAWCLFRLGDLTAAREAFQQAANALKAQNAPAADAEWMALLTEWSLSDDPPARRLDRISTESAAFRAKYPDHTGVAKVDDLITKLRREMATAEELTRDAGKDPATSLALVRKLHQRWGELPAAERLNSPQTATLDTAVRAALARIDAATDPAGRLDLLLIEIDLALAANPPDRDRARATLAEATPLVAKLASGDARIAEERFRRLQLARVDGDLTAVREQARWLVDHPGNSSHERAALTALAEQADETVSAATDADRPARAAEALAIHRRLASALADFPDRVRSNPNLRLVYTRMAGYAIDAGQGQTALRYVSLLQLARPDDPEIVRLAGLAYGLAGQNDHALACWRKLLDRLPPDSPRWFEAKFHQIEGLARDDPPRARRVWEQFRILHPGLGPDPWPAKFRDLAAHLP
jgi:tetratricopeptide (TPR) repeat protein